MSEPKPTYEAEVKGKVKQVATSTSALTLTALPAAEIADRWWLAFTPDHEPTAAAARFIDRTGAPPTFLVRTPTMLLVGPLALASPQRGAPAATGQPQHVYLADRASEARLAPTVTQGTLF